MLKQFISIAFEVFFCKILAAAQQISAAQASHMHLAQFSPNVTPSSAVYHAQTAAAEQSPIVPKWRWRQGTTQICDFSILSDVPLNSLPLHFCHI